MQLQIETKQSDRVGIIRCDGRVIFGPETDALRSTANELMEANPKLLIDLSRVRTIDSCGVGALVGIMVSARNRGGDLRIVQPSDKVNDVLRVTGLHTVFVRFATIEQGTASFDSPVGITA